MLANDGVLSASCVWHQPSSPYKWGEWFHLFLFNDMSERSNFANVAERSCVCLCVCVLARWGAGGAGCVFSIHYMTSVKFVTHFCLRCVWGEQLWVSKKTTITM